MIPLIVVGSLLAALALYLVIRRLRENKASS
jgi:hypothetical protein